MRGRAVIMEAQLDDSVQPRRELASRASGGIEVALYWSPFDNSTTVEVWDAASDETIVFAVPPERALQAFYHPFAQLASSFDELVSSPSPAVLPRRTTPTHSTMFARDCSACSPPSSRCQPSSSGPGSTCSRGIRPHRRSSPALSEDRRPNGTWRASSSSIRKST